MDERLAIGALGALAHEHRLAIFRALVRAGPAGLKAGEIARAAGIGATSLSFHIKELERAGLTRSWRDGRFVHSSIDVEGIRGLIAYLTEDCCEGRPELCGAGIAAAKVLCETTETSR
ncbi:MAG TPA: metalloregulator ArsR/SmtB family transcription factor [Hyphomicrobiaceae bacterium]|nr:metalloregulator ArsR/SmtB family transcription factor [Hyphomicrobiaceae bacterium]